MMNWVDGILNVAALLLWLNWRAGTGDPLGRRTPATLVGTLRRAEPLRMQRWHLPIVLGTFLFLRAVLYWQIGPALRWAGTLNLGVISLSFRSDWFGRIFLFSILSFALTLGIFYSWLLLLSLLKGPRPVQDFVRLQLGRIDGWSPAAKLALPPVVAAISWWLVGWVLTWLHINTQPASAICRIEESLVVALQSYLTWKFPLAALLVLYLLNNYVYFGKHPFWNYVDATGQTVLRPIKKIPLRVGRLDFTPVVGLTLVFLIAELAGRGLRLVYARLSY
jgi:uncharacterized protein YggT (Ycf19 family)